MNEKPSNARNTGKEIVPRTELIPKNSAEIHDLTSVDLRRAITEARDAWLLRSPSRDTRDNYGRDLDQFLSFVGVSPEQLEQLARVVPAQVAAWRDSLKENGLSNVSIRRKMTALRSLYSYLQTYGYVGPNPAHADFVQAPAAPRDGKTVALSVRDCRRLLDAPDSHTPVGVRDRAMLAVLAYTGCRVGELTRLRVGDYKSSGAHRILEIQGKGGKERRLPLHVEAVERLDLWLEVAVLWNERDGAIFRPVRTARGEGRDGFRERPITRRAIQYLVDRYVRRLGLDPAITVHSFRVTALTTARENGCDIVSLQDFAGHSDPRTTLGYIRNRDRLSKSPAYALKY